MRFSWLILLVCVFLSTKCNARTIKWLTHDFAPYYIISGPNKSQGRDESIISLLEQQLPHITFEIDKIGEGKDPWGGYRVGFEGETSLKLADYGIDYNLGPASTHVDIGLFIEGIRQ